jgi:hypothetical protein
VLDFGAVRAHYIARRRVDRTLRGFLEAGDAAAFAELALGISDPIGDFSAAEHRMGPMILAGAGDREILELGEAIDACSSVNHLPRPIYDRGIHGLKISIGSEIAMMPRPKRFWVGNVRTIWSHLVVKRAMDDDRANEELRLHYTTMSVNPKWSTGSRAPFISGWSLICGR